MSKTLNDSNGIYLKPNPGRPVTVNASKSLITGISETMKQEFTQAAFDLGISASELNRRLIKDFLRQQERDS